MAIIMCGLSIFVFIEGDREIAITINGKFLILKLCSEQFRQTRCSCLITAYDKQKSVISPHMCWEILSFSSAKLAARRF